MTETEMFYARIVSNVVAMLMVVVSWRWRNVGRLLFVVLFLWAGQLNFRTAVSHPEVYLEYAPLAYSELYRQFILGFFARHVTPIVGTIAVGQLVIAILVSLRERAVRIGLAGAIVFLVSILPLGIGAGFPATLIMALAAGILLRHTHDHSLWSGLAASWLRHGRRTSEALPEPASRVVPNAAYRLSIIVGVLLAVSSVCGLLFGARGVYDPDLATLPAFYSQDAATLVLALPTLIASMWLTRRGAPAGELLWSGTLFCVLYMYFFYVVGARFNALFLVYIAIEAASLFALLAILLQMNPVVVRERFAGAPVRPIGGFLVAIALLFSVMWIADVLRRLRDGEPLDPVSRFVYVADLTVLIPAAATAGVLSWQRRPWGYALGGLMLVKTALSGITLLIGTAFQIWWNRAVDPAQTLGFAVVASGGLFLGARFFRGRQSSSSAAPEPNGTSVPAVSRSEPRPGGRASMGSGLPGGATRPRLTSGS
jgi:hypothetical protein